jgi:hypothetical protein
MSTLSLTSRASRDDFPALRAAERAARGVNVTRASLVIVTGARRLDRRARHETLERSNVVTRVVRWDARRPTTTTLALALASAVAGGAALIPFWLAASIYVVRTHDVYSLPS